jgi:hypothetical protein
MMRWRASSMLALPGMQVALLITSPSFAGVHSVTRLGRARHARAMEKRL